MPGLWAVARPTLPQPHLQSGQQGGQVGQLFLEGFVLLFVLAGGGAGCAAWSPREGVPASPGGPWDLQSCLFTSVVCAHAWVHTRACVRFV